VYLGLLYKLCCRGWFVGLNELLGFAEEFFSFGVVFGSGH